MHTNVTTTLTCLHNTNRLELNEIHFSNILSLLLLSAPALLECHVISCHEADMKVERDDTPFSSSGSPAFHAVNVLKE